MLVGKLSQTSHTAFVSISTQRACTVPAQAGRRRPPAQSAPTQSLLQQQPDQQALQPDPAADDLDLLAASAAATAGANAGTGASLYPPALSAAAAAPLAPITSIPDAEPQYALPAGRRLHYTAADKLQLSGEQMRDIGRRLRTPRRGAGRVLRVWRYGIDDLRLYQALDLADLEGRVVVVDSSAHADAVLTTYSKRTHKNVNLATARRAAAGAGVPLLVLPAMSAQQLLQAIGPLLGLPIVQGNSPAAAGQQQGGQSWQPRLLRWDELEGDGSEELLQLMWGSGSSSSSSDASGQAGSAAAAGAVAGACCPTPRWHAWCAAQAASPGCAQALFEAVRDADVEDMREEAVPANPTARAGERHRLLRPSRPRSRIKRRQLRRDLAVRDVDW